MCYKRFLNLVTLNSIFSKLTQSTSGALSPFMKMFPFGVMAITR